MALVFIGIGSARIVATYYELSLTYDEPGHFACGLEYLSEHVYRLETQHPPLTRAAVAMGPYLTGIRLSPPNKAFPMANPRDSQGRQTLVSSGHADRMVALARLGNLPFFWLAGLVVYAWAKRYCDGGVAVLATCLFTLLPPVLAHAGVATTDIGLCACLTAAFFSLLIWAESPTWKSGVLLGVSAASAALAKFSALVFLPCAASFALLGYLAAARPQGRELLGLARSHAASFALAVMAGVIAIWAGYWFSFGVVPAWGIRLPAPEFFDGIREVAQHNSLGHATYLMGEKSQKGWWYYFPVMLSVKTPLAFLILLVTGVWTGCSLRANVRYWIPLAYSLGILFSAMMGSINIGVRHILPVYCGFAIVAALGLARLLQTPGRAAGLLAGSLLIWMAASGAVVHPDYLSYFNEIAPVERAHFTVDSDLDWGQSLKLAGRELHASGATEVATNLPDSMTMASINGLPVCKPVDYYTPSGGWNMISPTIATYDAGPQVVLRGTDFESLKRAREIRHVWWDRLTPTRRVGGLLLYYIPPNSPLLQ